MTQRPATLTDVPDLVRVINLAYLVEAEMFHGSRTTDADIRERLARPNAAFLTVRDGASLAAAVYVETRGSRGYFGMLAVDPAFQGRGLGRELVRAAETYARSAECDAMDLDVVDLRSELTVFYGRLGYERVGDSPYPRPGETKRPVRLIHMTKRLRCHSEPGCHSERSEESSPSR
jgi:ribosomal protein S18 acetylase RimI-like enzyme